MQTKQTIIFDVFLSHDSADYALVNRVWQILTRMKIKAYMYERYPQYGQYLPETIKQMLKASKYVVVFWTRDGVTSQWVNQEVGIAIGVAPEFQSIVIPVQEMGVKVKGFTDPLLHIDYDPYNPDWMILSLIYELRKRLGMDKGSLTIDCDCGHRFESTLPTFDLVNETIERGDKLSCTCTKCQRVVWVSPYTLEVTLCEGPPAPWWRT